MDEKKQEPGEEQPRPIVSGGRLRKRRKDGWTRRQEKIFIRHLRATSNIRASARAAGKSASSAFDLRKRDPRFAAEWDEALREAAPRLHSKLIVFAETKGKPVEPDEDGEPGEADLANFDPDLAFKLIKFHEGRLAGGRRGDPQPERASEEELTAALMVAFDALERRLAKKKI